MDEKNEKIREYYEFGRELTFEKISKEISMREEFVLLEDEYGIIVESNRNRLNKLKKELIQIKCPHVFTRSSYSNAGISTRDIIDNNYCPECGICLRGEYK